MSKYRILLALLLVLSLGCGLLGGDGDDGDTSGNGDGVTQDGNGGGGGDDGGNGASGDGVQIDDISAVDSYRSTMEYWFTPDTGEPEGLYFEQEYIREPPASRLYMESEGEGVEFVQIGTQSWMCFDSTCALTQMTEDDLLTDIGIGLEDFSLDDSELDYEGSETLDGVRTRRYSVDLSLAAVIALSSENVSDSDAKVWIADESDLPAVVVKYEATWREEREEGAGTSEFLYEVYDINESFTIEPPENAASWPEDVPAYPNAADLTIMEGVVGFTTEDSIADVTSFYGDELPDNGWSMDSEMDLGTAVMQTWSKDGQELSLTAGEENGETSVLIIIS